MMKNNGWVEAAEEIAPHVVKLEVPDSAGSGFFVAYRKEGKQKIAVIATAAHVIEHAFKWSEPIRITGHKRTVLLTPEQYHMFLSDGLDMAIIEVPWEAVDFPPNPLPSANPKDMLPAGSPIAWCGYPNIVEDVNCLFTGHISASIVDRGDYLIDGVVIHGVSGGPAFVCENSEITIVGLLSQYLPNRATGESLPGLGVVRSIAPLTQYFDDQEMAEKKRTRRK